MNSAFPFPFSFPFPRSCVLPAGQGREEHPLPTQAPWTVFLGNLAFDVTESDVNNFFSGLSVRRWSRFSRSCHDDACG